MTERFFSILLISLALLFFPGRSRSADFLIAENPSQLRLLNAFQQTFTRQSHQAIPPFTPFRILNKSMFLSDGLTPAMKCAFAGKIYFILLDEDGRVLGAQPPILTGCRVISDTMVVSGSVRVNFTRGPDKISPGGGNGRILTSGESVIRFFSYNGAYYTALPGNPLTFGWCQVASESAWTRPSPNAEQKTAQLPDDAVHRLRRACENYNSAAQRIFGFYKNRTGKELSPPQWIMTANNGQWTLELTDHRQVFDLGNSVTVLQSELEAILRQTGYYVRNRSGIITISPEN
jgi:hypothetical protein